MGTDSEVLRSASLGNCTGPHPRGEPPPIRKTLETPTPRRHPRMPRQQKQSEHPRVDDNQHPVTATETVRLVLQNNSEVNSTPARRRVHGSLTPPRVLDVLLALPDRDNGAVGISQAEMAHELEAGNPAGLASPSSAVSRD